MLIVGLSSTAKITVSRSPPTWVGRVIVCVVVFEPSVPARTPSTDGKPAPADGETLDDGLTLGLVELDGLAELDGERDELGDTLGDVLLDGLTLLDGETDGELEADGLRLELLPPDGLTLLDGLTLCDTLALGDTDADGDTLSDGDRDTLLDDTTASNSL
jgi:hypothetical protein